MTRAFVSCSLAAAAFAAACTGSGSDVGPALDNLPSASHKVLVLDDAGRGASAARVVIGNATAVTGRAGRGDLLANPTGRQLVRVDAINATAVAGDRLASLAFAAAIPGQDLSYAVFLPDTGSSATQAVATGVALAATTLDDTATSGARLLLGNGTVVAATGATATLRLGALQRPHLPGELPAATSGVRLWTRAIFVEPATATFAPAATLELPDDLGLPGATTAEVFHLDATGEWTQVATNATAAGGRLSAPGIAAGGLYACCATIAATATVSGRVLDLQDRAVAEALVRVDAVATRTDSGGRFQAVVAAELADGSARTVDVEVRGGALWLPTGGAVVSPALGNGAIVDLGDVRLDSLPAGNLRLQAVTAGRAEALRRIAYSSNEGTVAAAAFTDARGQCTFEDLPAGWFGVLNGRPIDRFEVFLSESIGLFGGGRRWDEARVYFDDRNWVVGSRSTRALVLDAVGGGPVREAVVVRGSVPGSGFSGTTREGGVVFVGRSFDGRATASVRTVLGSSAVTSAFTIDRPNADHLELPVRRALRTVGAFDRHGTLRGNLVGFVGGADHRLRASRPLEFDEWCDQVLVGAPATTALPARLGDGAAAAFRFGVAQPRGHAVAVEGTTAGSVFTMTGIAAALDLEVAEGSATSADLVLARTFATFTVPQGAVALDAALGVADFTYDLAWQAPSGLLVDVVRGVGGGIAASGDDLTLQLPALAGEFAGGAWWVALSATDALGTVRQQSLVRFDGATATATPLSALPTITAPTDGATVAADGFSVDFALPVGTLYATLQLTSPGAEALEWTVVVPGDATSFQFVRLPTEARTALVAGRSYSLTLTAARADTGEVLLQQDPYRELTNFWMSLGVGERGVRALSSRTIQITAN